ncbi:MAG TPA: hypothetical protein PLJ47_08695 [Candidatus Hydrogenedentes bacterium]|nr:hypothetical protein [Candidatus Hydrogenedentota bacterium]
MYRRLDAKGISLTAAQLQRRISNKFPGSGLSKVAEELVEIARGADSRAVSITAPSKGLRIAVGLGILALLSISLLVLIRYSPDFAAFSFAQFVEILDALINIAVLIGGAVFSLVTIENRLQRSRALKAAHELRAMAHVIDMHQLTKHPEHMDEPAHPEIVPMPSSELTTYLSLCTELLSLIGKLGAFYVQDFDDELALDAVNELEDLTTGLSQKMWQKITIVEQGR